MDGPKRKSGRAEDPRPRLELHRHHSTLVAGDEEADLAARFHLLTPTPRECGHATNHVALDQDRFVVAGQRSSSPYSALVADLHTSPVPPPLLPTIAPDSPLAAHNNRLSLATRDIKQLQEIISSERRLVEQCVTALAPLSLSPLCPSLPPPPPPSR